MVPLLVALRAAPLRAEEPASPLPYDLTLGGRLWATTATSSRNLSAVGFPRLSELRFRGVDAVVPEVNVDFVWKRLVVLGNLGGGVIKNGVLLDEDFAADGERIGRTRSEVDDSHLFFVSTDVGARLFDWTAAHAGRGFLDVLVGAQYWQERYVAFGGPGFPAPVESGVKAISNRYEWTSLRVGLRTEVPIAGGVSVALRGYLIPWTSLVIEDIHYLRSDLRRDPSFRDEATGGIGAQVDGAIRYAITPHLSAELGFQYWMLKSGEGDEIAFATSGAGRQTLKEARTERYGPFAGVRWRF
jgi:hypothetical protein